VTARPLAPQLPVESPAQKEARMEWWTEARFGMFIHWGLYALPARHEWVKKNERMTDATYQKYFDLFNPDLYDARAWARMARQAGMMRRHHLQAPRGVLLFDSKFTDYNATRTPAGRDLIGMGHGIPRRGLRVASTTRCSIGTTSYCRPQPPAERDNRRGYAKLNQGGT
jgi:hypothetical protein